MLPTQRPSSSPLHLRIFLASPGDVADERNLAIQALEQLQYDPLLRGKITVETVAWDKLGGGTPMLAILTPQEAIAKNLPKPAECDIVIVINNQPMVEVAHEALLRNWPRLAKWIKDNQEDLRLLKRLRIGAAEWDQHDRGNDYLWPERRRIQTNDMVERLRPTLTEVEKAFLYMEQSELIEEFKNPLTTPQRRVAIGVRLAEIGDLRPGTGLRPDGLPFRGGCGLKHGVENCRLQGVKASPAFRGGCGLKHKLGQAQ